MGFLRIGPGEDPVDNRPDSATREQRQNMVREFLDQSSLFHQSAGSESRSEQPEPLPEKDPKIQVGLSARNQAHHDDPAQAAEQRRRAGTITDVRGEKVKVREICFGGKPYLIGRIGEGEIRTDTERIAFIRVDHTGPDCTVEVTMTDGEKTVLKQDSNLILSAASSVGLYAIPFHRVRSISFL